MARHGVVDLLYYHELSNFPPTFTVGTRVLNDAQLAP